MHDNILMFKIGCSHKETGLRLGGLRSSNSFSPMATALTRRPQL